VQVARDVDGQGGLDRPVQEEEQPRERGQAQQVAATQQDPEAGLGSVCVDWLLGLGDTRRRAPGPPTR